MRKDDFFPFADDPDAYWSGFFTTRPILKRMDREVGELYHSSLRLHSMVVLNKKSSKEDHEKIKDS
jgi:alpha-mannosidase